ncbi:MAG: hypothetical protein PHU88_05555 [candidate division Zixibacteria bacterium]|nr:hypothetical protein [candidate division Zixibacteria bacterium]MDD5426110.1 hypothetical protein [candidate division Zixibacteria bacterium]
MKNNNNLRKDKPPLSYDKLLYITEEAYFLSKNRPEWCHKIFELLENESEYQNFIKKHELLRAIITINMKYVELDGHCPQPVKPMLPELYKAITDVKKETLDWLMPAVIKKYNDKGKISPEQAQLLLQAVDIYLSDFGFYGDTDSIPSYFYEMFPEINSKEYLDKYKNIFETIISKALEDLKKRLKNNSTIRAFGYYYNFGIE